MGKTIARWINFDVESLSGTTTLTVLLDGSGGLAKTASGIKINAGSVTNDMLSGSIELSKLVETVIQADGGQDFTADQGMGNHKLTGLQNGTAQTDAINLSQLQGAVSGLDFQADVLDKQTDATLDPGATPTTGDRYIITNAGSLHANFGSITGVGDNDIVQYDGTDFIVSYDVSAEGEGALAWDESANVFQLWDGTSWEGFGGLSGVTAGDGLDKTSNTMFVKVSDLVGTGIEDDGSNNFRLATQGNGIAGGNGSTLSVNPDATTGGDTAPVTVGADGVGVDVTSLDGDHLGVDFTPTNYTPDSAPAEASDDDDLAAHLKGIDTALAAVGASGSPLHQYLVEITAGMITAGSFTLPSSPVAAKAVFVHPVGGPQQINKQTIGGVSVTPDFDVLNTDEVHINNNGTATGLSETFVEDDIVMVDYEAAS